MRRVIASLWRQVVLALALALAPASVPVGVAQVAADTLAPVAEVAPASADVQATATGLPRRAPVPRTMEAHWPVFTLFAVSWIGIMGYLLVTGRRSERLTRALREREERP